jgi:hypothetical protein
MLDFPEDAGGIASPENDNGRAGDLGGDQRAVKEQPSNEACYERDDNSSPEPAKALRSALDPNSKKAAMLRVFLRVRRSGINCFTAALDHGDFVLRSTVSDFARDYGIEFDREDEVVPGRNGSQVRCKRYWLSDTSIERARRLLGETS